ncbi:MAG: GNAT family N-acetyltransferase [Erysipelotrichaceae bacterium]|nr:GNAT family N-acetyltransferase [Erysipelotrichaceae bacterium]
MIQRGTQAYKNNIRDLWKSCYPDWDKNDMDYYYAHEFEPEQSLVVIDDSRIVATISRVKKEMMFNGRVIRTSFLQSLAALPAYQGMGYEAQLMDVVSDEISHTELLTLARANEEAFYRAYGFETLYYRKKVTITRDDLSRLSNEGIVIDPPVDDMLNLYARFSHRFNGFMIRDRAYYENLKMAVGARRGKIVGYYDDQGLIEAYSILVPKGKELDVEEVIYMDSKSLYKMLNVALQQRQIVHVHVGSEEQLEVLLPQAKVEKYGYIMVRLNNLELFNRLFQSDVTGVGELAQLSDKPLYMNENR